MARLILKELAMKIAEATPVLAAFLVAACGVEHSRPAALDQTEQRDRADEQNVRQARLEADKARDTMKAREAEQNARWAAAQAAREAEQNAQWTAAQAAREAEQNARWTAEHTSLAERHEQSAQGPRKGSTELQGDSQRGYKNETVFFFAAAQADLSPEAKRRLDTFADFVRATAHDERVVIEGHADDYVGAETRNVELSRQRADEVADYLESRGIAKDKIRSKGFGSRNGIGTRDAGLNRRAQIWIETARR
ncbi:MAG TPA: OmpA family protein [Polyangiaceae bacterium]|nr:OmpA family protein [Polyangiaceae bacterium]